MGDDGGETTSIGLVLAAFSRHRERVAIRHAGGELTYGELVDHVHRTARALRAQGLGRGDLVALLTGNRADTVVLRYAANVLGCCVGVLYDGLAPGVLTDMLRSIGASALVFAPDRYAGQARAVLAGLPELTALALGQSPHGADLSALAEAEPAEPVRVEARAQDLASIRFTSGSTGTPKGIPHDFRVPRHLSSGTLTAWRDSTQLLCTPIGHLGGMLAEVVLAAGGVVVLHEGFNAGAVLAAIERERVSFVWLLPSLLHQLLDHPALERTNTSSLRMLALGGWASTPSRVQQAIERFGPIVAQGYGTNEIGQVSWLSPDEHLRPELLTTVGRPVPGAEVSIRDSSGEPVGTGATGEIWVRGPGMMTGYHRRREETGRVLRYGWFRSGDLGFLDAEGYLSVVGRRSDVVIVAGGHVHPADVEDVLHRHPGIREAVVFGVTAGDNDERLCVAVVPTSAGRLAESEVADWLRDHRGAMYQPDVLLVRDELPTAGSGKPDREALRRIAQRALRAQR